MEIIPLNDAMLATVKIPLVGTPIQGPIGKSAYEVAVEQGFAGTASEWLESLHGQPGNPGENGREVSLQATTTDLQWRLGEDQWFDLIPLADLEGPKGYDGWTMVPAVVLDGNRSIIQIVDWINGQGPKPETGLYIGQTGLVAEPFNATNIRGPGAGDLLSTNNLSELVDKAAARANLGLRYVGGRTFYVRKDGSDSNDGLTNNAAGAFLTIQRAVNAAYAIDAKGNVVQIQIGDGTYAESVNIYGRLVGAFDNGDQPFRVIGNEANPAAVVINPTNADAIRVGDKATLLLAGVTIRTTTSGNGIAASNHAFIQHRNCRFGNIAGEMIATTSKAFVQAIGNTNIVGDAASFVHATNNSIVTFSGRTLTYEGTRVFSGYLYGLNTSVLDLSSTTIVGKGGGGITVHVNSILNVSSCVGVWTGGQPMFVSNGGLISAEDKVAAKTFYVRPDGNNQNSGFDNTPDGAFFSLGAALNRLRVMPYDLVSQENDGAGSYDWRIVLSAGTFDEAVELPDTRFARVTIQGASPTTTIAKSYTSRALRTVWTISNQQLGGSGVACLTALEGAQLNFSNIAVVASSYIGICDNNARMSSLGQPFSILGNLSAAFLTRFGGRVALNGSAVTITGTPSIGRFAMAQTNASIFANGMTFTGTATGNRYDARSNGVIDTNENPAGVNFFPGNAAGNVSSGGQYV